MAVLKYKIHEAAKDFGKKSSDIIDLLAQFSDEPKKYQTVLTPADLDIIFDAFTQQTATDDLSDYFNMPAPEGCPDRFKKYFYTDDYTDLPFESEADRSSYPEEERMNGKIDRERMNAKMFQIRY